MNDIRVIGIAGLILLATLFSALYVSSAEVVQFTVTDKERIVTGSGDTSSSKYLVFTETEVLQNSDSLLFLKFSSSDIQGSLKEGSTYQAKVAGWRIPFLSMYRNIVGKPNPH